MEGDSYMTSSTPAPGGKSLPRCVISCPLGREKGQRMSSCPALAHKDSLNLQMASPEEIQLSFLNQIRLP